MLKKRREPIEINLDSAVMFMDRERQSVQQEIEQHHLRIQATEKIRRFLRDNKNNPYILPLMLGVAKRGQKAANKEHATGVTKINAKSMPIDIIRYALTTMGHALSLEDIARIGREHGAAYAPSSYDYQAKREVERGNAMRVGRNLFALPTAGTAKLVKARAAMPSKTIRSNKKKKAAKVKAAPKVKKAAKPQVEAPSNGQGDFSFAEKASVKDKPLALAAAALIDAAGRALSTTEVERAFRRSDFPRKPDTKLLGVTLRQAEIGKRTGGLNLGVRGEFVKVGNKKVKFWSTPDTRREAQT